MQTPVQNNNIVVCRWTSFPIAVGAGVKSFKVPPTKKNKSWHGAFIDPGCAIAFMLAEHGGDASTEAYIASSAAFVASLQSADPTFVWEVAPPCTALSSFNRGGTMTFEQYFASYNHSKQVEVLDQVVPDEVDVAAAPKKSAFHAIRYAGKNHCDPQPVDAFPQSFLTAIDHLGKLVSAETGFDRHIGITIGATGLKGEIKSFALYDAGSICGDPCIAAEHELGPHCHVPANKAVVYSRNMQRVEKSAKKTKRPAKRQKPDEPTAESDVEEC